MEYEPWSLESCDVQDISTPQSPHHIIYKRLYTPEHKHLGNIFEAFFRWGVKKHVQSHVDMSDGDNFPVSIDGERFKN